ncbi:MAG TPA: hypothetical protein VFV79_10300 [Saprospiraceae bacterium]|nr:hypothetical protein [Saprospiraceae bacterium]
MSEELKRKLYNYEVEPPEIMWNRISTALDEEINAEFPQKLYELDVTPPLDTWNRIEKELEEVSVEKYPAKLYNIEVTPPPHTWNKILALLEEKALPRINSRKRLVSFVRYGIAACIVGVLAWGALKVINHKPDGLPVAVRTVTPQKDSSTGLNQNTARDKITAPSNNLPKEGALLARAEPKSRKKTAPEPATYMTTMATTCPASVRSRSMSDFRQASLKGDVPGSCSVISEADPYLMFVNPDGYLIRISKKLAETLGCVYTNGNSAEYNRCEDQIRKWRDKIAQSPATSSPDNFLDILNVIKSVQE